MEDLQKRLDSLGMAYVTDADGKTISSYRGGGKLAFTISPRNMQELAATVKEVLASGIPYTVLGACTNCLIRDNGYPGAAICTKKLKGLTQSGTYITAATGEPLPALAEYAAKNNLGGLETLSGIPSSVGGAIFMNAGAFGQEIGGLLAEAEVFDIESLTLCRMEAKEIPFSYRSSGNAFRHKIICSATFRLQDGYDQQRDRHCREERLKKQPREPSLGSVFKNPPVFAAGYLIEAVGLKGFRLGNAAFSDKHANFIVNLGGGTAKDYLSLTELAQSMVYTEYKIELETEIRILG